MLRRVVLGVARTSVSVSSSSSTVPAWSTITPFSGRHFSQQASTPSNASGTEELQQQSAAGSNTAAPSREALDLARKILTSPEFFDQPQLNKKAKAEAIKAFRRHPVDTGSSEVQVAVLSERIMRLQAHFEGNKKDVHSRRGLMELMQRRRKLLLYMASRDPEAYVRVIEKYQIREGKGASRVSDRPEDWSPPRNKEDVKYRPKTWLEFKAGTGKDLKRKA